MKSSKRVLLVDLNDTRRKTRVRILKQAGYDVDLRLSHIDAESLGNEGHFDLVILPLHAVKLEEASAYSERLRKRIPTLPIRLLTDYGVFVPRGTLSASVETGNAAEMLREIASMIAESHIREIDTDGSIVIPHERSSLQLGARLLDGKKRRNKTDVSTWNKLAFQCPCSAGGPGIEYETMRRKCNEGDCLT